MIIVFSGGGGRVLHSLDDTGYSAKPRIQGYIHFPQTPSPSPPSPSPLPLQDPFPPNLPIHSLSPYDSISLNATKISDKNTKTL